MTNEAKPLPPLTIPVFRALWIATVVSNIGTWMHDVGAGWLMASLTNQAFMVAMIQAATTFPMFVLALPAGALADIIDRRRLLLGAQLFGAVVALTLAALSFAGLVNVYSLLALTALLALTSALSAPAFQAIVPELVPHKSLQQAVALNSLGINIARAIGPAVGGLIIARAGTAAVFALNSVSVIGVVAVLWRWERKVPQRQLPPEELLGAMRAGLRYAIRSPQLRTVLVRSVGFFTFASALWALLPIIAKRELSLDAGGYGLLLAVMGAGAVTGALTLARLRPYLSTNGTMFIASVLLSMAMAAMSFAHSFWTAALALFSFGMAWIGAMASLNGSAQSSAPTWVKARALAIYLLVFQGAMATGAAVWGSIASVVGIPATLQISSGLLFLIGAILSFRAVLGSSSIDISPSAHWPTPVVATDIEHDSGPVLVTIEYEIDPARSAEFMSEMQIMRAMRKRDGAIHWGIYEDTTQPGIMIETFTAESWLEHLRQHERVTMHDRQIQDRLAQFQVSGRPPIVRHFVTPRT